MGLEEIRQHLEAISAHVSGIKKVEEIDEANQIKLQLRMIEKTIKQMNKSGVQIPEGLISDRVSLQSKIEKIAEGPTEVSRLYEELINIVDQIGLRIQRHPHKDLYNRIKERRKQTIPKDIIRNTILDVLKKMGGNGHQRDILKGVGEELNEQFTAADLEIQYGKSHRWETNVLKERKRMIKDGILTQESKKNRWSLKKMISR